MATSYNTYIGARYVPIIDGEWDNTKEYEPLVIVTYQGDSYTSKTYVPVGAEITNTTYWVCTGNYNAQVEAYREEVQTLTTNFDTLSESFDNQKMVNVKDYGAKGDNVTDDTIAFQNALNSGYNVYIPMSNGEHYLISSVLDVTTPQQEIFSFNTDLVTDDITTDESKCGYINATSNVFNVTVQGVRIIGLSFRNKSYEGDYQYTNAAITIDATSINDNADALVQNCSFYGFSNCIVNYGRGTGIKNCSFFAYATAITQHYTYDGSGGSDVQQPLTGDRAFRVLNNRFHLGNLCIKNASGALIGAIISGNVNDSGAWFIDVVSGGMIACNITNNTTASWNKAVWMLVRAGVFYNNVVSGNVVTGLADKTTTNRFIQIDATVTDFSNNVISNNNVNHCIYDAILVNPISTKNVFSGNVFNDICSVSSTTVGGIRFNSDVIENVITGNAFNFNADSISNGAIMFINTPTVSGVQMGYNVSDKTFVYGTYTQGDKTNVLQS